MENNKKLPENIEAILREPLDEKAITKHPTKTYLSSIKAVYVTERFNKAFGIGGWKTKVKFVTDGGGGMIVVKVIFTVPEYDIYYECFGGNDNGGENNKNFDLGDAYKGATTDALTKIGSYMEVGLNVFKGLNDNNNTTTPKQEDDRPWLTEDGFKYLKNKGSYQEIKTAIKDRRMKRTYRSELDELITKKSA